MQDFHAGDPSSNPRDSNKNNSFQSVLISVFQNNPLPVMVFGFLAVGVCFLFFGPSPLFGLQNYQ